MSNPTRNGFKTDPVLTRMQLAWMQDPSKFSYGKLAPSVQVKEKTGRYFSWDRGDAYRDDARVVGPCAPAPITGQRLSKDTYECEVIEIATQLSEQDMAESQVDLDSWATNFLMQKINISLEKKAMSEFLTAVGAWDNEVVPANKWDVGAGDPIAEITGAMDDVEGATGSRPNHLFLPRRVATALKNRDDIVDRYKHTQAGIITEDLLAAVFGVQSVVVGAAVQNTGPEGGTEATDFIATDNALLYYVPASPSIREPSAMYSFVWSALTGMNQLGGRMRRFDDMMHKCEHIEAQYACDLKVTSSALGYRFDNVLT